MDITQQVARIKRELAKRSEEQMSRGDISGARRSSKRFWKAASVGERYLGNIRGTKSYRRAKDRFINANGNNAESIKAQNKMYLTKYSSNTYKGLSKG